MQRYGLLVSVMESHESRFNLIQFLEGFFNIPLRFQNCRLDP